MYATLFLSNSPGIRNYVAILTESGTVSMSDSEFAVIWPEDFCGTVKLFPLPNLVLFPHVVQPLHIFEPRYCSMLMDALNSDQLIAMALLQPNWEAEYDQKPAIAPTVCIGKIISHAPTENNRHNLLLVGVKRARIIREHCSNGKPYRTAEVEIIEDQYPEEESPHRAELLQKLQELFLRFVPEGLAAQESFRQLVGKQLPLGVLTDTITFAIDLPIAIKLQLLAEENVDIRCRILTRCLQQKLGSEGASKESDSAIAGSDFPPPFSKN
jgi:uncharacterized protein